MPTTPTARPAAAPALSVPRNAPALAYAWPADPEADDAPSLSCPAAPAAEVAELLASCPT